jgi:HAD superfamily hydrolase (TIGR01662 family)
LRNAQPEVRLLRKAIIFDLGNTLVVEKRDDRATLDKLTLVPIQDAEIVLRRLHKYYKLGLLSNTEQSRAVHLSEAMARLGWRGLFDSLASSIDIGARKPARSTFEYVLDALGTAPEETVMVGNDLKADIEGANRCGMETVFYSNAESDWQALPRATTKPDHIVSHLKDLLSIFLPN